MTESAIKKLIPLGWTDYFSSQLPALGSDQLRPARVITEERGGLIVAFSETETIRAEVPGRLRHAASSRSDLPAVGDWVLVEAQGGAGRIESVLPRITCLVRKAAGTEVTEQILAANVDIVFIVCSMNEDLSLRRIERYLVLVWNSGATPVILLTKSDLVPNPEQITLQVQDIAPGVQVIPLSVHKNQNTGNLQKVLHSGMTAVLVGSSGVGKSTIVNFLKGIEVQKTQEIRDDDKGKHTTTARNLIVLPSGALLIDTPGLREVQLWLDEEGLSTVFEDIEALALKCRFTNCQHASEPHCAVKGAIDKGELAKDRFESYLRLKKEIAFEVRKTDKAAASEEKAKWKKVNKDLREKYKHRNRT